MHLFDLTVKEFIDRLKKLPEDKKIRFIDYMRNEDIGYIFISKEDNNQLLLQEKEDSEYISIVIEEETPFWMIMQAMEEWNFYGIYTLWEW